jgi:DNA-binding protein WhiA
MSFSSSCKSELCRLPLSAPSSARAELYGALLFGRVFSEREVKVSTAREDTAERLERLLNLAFNLSFTRQTAGTRYSLALDEPAAVIDALGAPAPNVHLNRAILSDRSPDDLAADFLRGAFLTGGHVSEEYHLELETPRVTLSRELSSLLADCGFPEPKVVRRAGHYALYYKSAEHIEDFLVMLGAAQSAMRLMELQVERDVRNRVNRKVNCETANSGRAVGAAIKQSDAFEYLKNSARWDNLPENLKIAANIRLSHPEETLAELAARLGISKSGLNHRIRKLLEIAAR